jgi:hypothetical protein
MPVQEFITLKNLWRKRSAAGEFLGRTELNPSPLEKSEGVTAALQAGYLLNQVYIVLTDCNLSRFRN